LISEKKRPSFSIPAQRKLRDIDGGLQEEHQEYLGQEVGLADCSFQALVQV
jgi:hypothetical protein